MPNPNLPTSYTGLEEMPPTPHEMQQKRDQIVMETNEYRDRVRLRRANQAAGFGEPKPGDVIYVQLDSTVKNRTRAGIRFERGVRRTVTVVEQDGDELLAMQRGGQDVVDVYGAERILEDPALHVYQSAASEMDVQELQSKVAALEEENRLMRTEHEALKKRVREARQGAQPSPTGAPTRLQAAAAARGESGAGSAGSESSPEFGAPSNESGKPTKPSQK